MKKILFVLVVVLLTMAGCGGKKTDKEVSSVESSPKVTEDNSTDETNDEKDNEETKKEESKTIDEVLVDNDNLKATLTNIVKVEDKEWDEERYDIHIKIENKREDTIEVQAHEVSADGKMIDDSVSFSETVAGGKYSDATMVIESYGEEDGLPDLNENLEFTLVVFSNDDYDYEEKHNVSIQLK